MFLVNRITDQNLHNLSGCQLKIMNNIFVEVLEKESCLNEELEHS